MGQRQSKYIFKLEDWPFVWAMRDNDVLDWKAGLEAEEILAICSRQIDPPVVIIPACLYLGDKESVQDIDKLCKLGIQRVLNMAGNIFDPTTIQALHNRGIRYKEIAAQDNFSYPLLDLHWKEAETFLQEGRLRGETMLVNCRGGWNRSGLVAATFYLSTHPESTNVVDTVGHIRRARGNYALHNEGFQEQLVAFAREHKLPLGIPPKPACPPHDIVTTEGRGQKNGLLDGLVSFRHW